MGVLPPDSMTAGRSPAVPVSTCCRRPSTAVCSWARSAKRRSVRLAIVESSFLRLHGTLPHRDVGLKARAAAHAVDLDLGAGAGARDMRQDVLGTLHCGTVECRQDVAG